jgi:hypothetical protein
MNGQWIGRYSGSNSGELVVDLDDLGTHYEGCACAYEDNTTALSTFVPIVTSSKESSFELLLPTHPIDPRTGEVTSWNQIASSFPQATFPNQATVRANCEDDQLNVSWTTNIGASAEAHLPRTRAHQPTEYEPLPQVTNWDEFKTFVNGLKPRQFIFRGQRELLRLRTGFHRTGRANLFRFLANDIPTLHRHLSSRTGHIFNLGVPDENGAFFNLVQHHGYPTPLLDWTYSPYVAAFFAYHRLNNSEAARADESQKVRIFRFDQKQWVTKFTQFKKVTLCRPHFSIIEFIAIENQRLVPQQSISSITNVDDIETYLRSLEERAGDRYLTIIDLPVKERPRVMRELSVMGITAGSLFPGIDGTCEALKEQNFDV